MKVLVKYDHGTLADLRRGHAHDAGLDMPMPEAYELAPHETHTINTGVHVDLPAGTAGMLIARSSAAKRGLVVGMSPIDSGYTGPIHIVVTNTSNESQNLEKGKSIAQLVIFQIIVIEPVEDLGPKRHDGAFGSTDIDKKSI